MFIFKIRFSKDFVLRLRNHTDSETVCLGYTFVTFCIVSSFSFRHFFPLMSPELNMIVMCHNVILVLIKFIVTVG